jgi:hypothetical protein
MGKTTICIRCGRHKIEINGVLCRVCEYEKRKNQEKRQRSQNYKKYGIRETDSERALRIKSEKKEKAEQKKKEADAQKKAQKKKEEKKNKLEQEKINNEKITGYYETNSQRKSRESAQKAEMVSNFRETGLRETNLERERREYYERDKNFRLYGREALDSEL